MLTGISGSKQVQRAAMMSFSSFSICSDDISTVAAGVSGAGGAAGTSGVSPTCGKDRRCEPVCGGVSLIVGSSCGLLRRQARREIADALHHLRQASPAAHAQVLVQPDALEE